MTAQVGETCKCQKAKRPQANCQTVDSIGQINRVAGRRQDQHDEENVERPEVYKEPLHKRNARQRTRVFDERIEVEKETQREKYAKLGVKILDRKRKINSLLDTSIEAVQMIAQTHGELLRILQDKDKPLRPLAHLVNFAGRLEAMYTEYANEKKKK